MVFDNVEGGVSQRYFVYWRRQGFCGSGRNPSVSQADDFSFTTESCLNATNQTLCPCRMACAKGAHYDLAMQQADSCALSDPRRRFEVTICWL